MNVGQFIARKGLGRRVGAAFASCGQDLSMMAELEALPVKKSRALKRLGSYVSRAGEPVEIRLQFAQEEERLIETFLHELAHCLDHVVNQKDCHYRRAHGEGWKRWAEALGIRPVRSGESEALRKLESERMKVVAVCKKCGFRIRRLRKLAGKRNYVHRQCGGTLHLL